MNQLKTISLFSGAYGLDLGLEEAGFDVIWANELEKVFCDTITVNRPNVTVQPGDIDLINPAQLLQKLNLKPGELTLLCGGPPCQSFSTAGRRLSIQDARGNLIFTFIKWVDIVRPKYFLMENVKGLLSAAIKHRSLIDRQNGLPLDADELKGSALELVLSEMKKIGYTVTYKLLNSADYGVPQARERVVFIGSRDGHIVEFPKPTHSNDTGDNLKPRATLRDAIGSLHEINPQFSKYSPARLRWLSMVPEGGNWRSLPKELQREAMGGAYLSGGGKVGFYRRLAWDKPSPTVTTSPHQKATDMCHPIENRPLSVREYARIQQFPDDWIFIGSISQQYKQIGNAVPVGLAKAVGIALKEHIDRLDKENILSPKEREQRSATSHVIAPISPV